MWKVLEKHLHPPLFSRLPSFPAASYLQTSPLPAFKAEMPVTMTGPEFCSGPRLPRGHGVAVFTPLPSSMLLPTLPPPCLLYLQPHPTGLGLEGPAFECPAQAFGLQLLGSTDRKKEWRPRSQMHPTGQQPQTGTSLSPPLPPSAQPPTPYLECLQTQRPDSPPPPPARPGLHS